MQHDYDTEVDLDNLQLFLEMDEVAFKQFLDNADDATAHDVHSLITGALAELEAYRAGTQLMCTSQEIH